MIRIDSTVQPHTTFMHKQAQNSEQSEFAALLAEQAARTAATQKSILADDKTSDLKGAASSNETNPHDDLLRLLSMSPAERIRYQVLQQLGLSEEAFQALPIEERMKIEQMIKEEIERQMTGRDAGSIAIHDGQ